MEFSNASHCSLNIYLFIFFYLFLLIILPTYEGWNFNSGNYLFTTDTK